MTAGGKQVAGQAATQAEMVGVVVVLHPKPVRAVRHPDAADTQVRSRVRRPVVGARGESRPDIPGHVVHAPAWRSAPHGESDDDRTGDVRPRNLEDEIASVHLGSHGCPVREAGGADIQGGRRDRQANLSVGVHHQVSG